MLSIIIPIYKVEEYIERCARSLMEQTLQEDVEFIFINDCTPDRSMAVLSKVLDDYPNRQTQIRVLNNPHNIGICETRKRGIKEAKGEYIGWCDSDDWVDPEMYESIYSTAKSYDLDVVTCDYIAEYGTKSELFQPGYDISITGRLKNLWKWNGFARCLWQQVMKKELLEFAAKNLKTTNYAEDFYMVVLSYSQASTCKHLPIPFYHYNRSVTRSLSTSQCIRRTFKQWEEQRANIEHIYKILCNTNDGKRKFQVACSRLKFETKSEYYSAFKDKRYFYNGFKECYSDIMEFTDIPFTTRLKLRIVYSSYITYYLYSRLKQ